MRHETLVSLRLYLVFFKGQCTADDQDGQDTVTFVLLDNTEWFEIVDGHTLRTTQVLDYEKLNSYRLTVQARDSSTPLGMVSAPLTFLTAIRKQVRNV